MPPVLLERAPSHGLPEVSGPRCTWRVLLNALTTTQGLGDQPSVSTYEFTTLKALPDQIDGEVKSVDATALVKIESAPAALPILG
jgi:diacylglycerol kinase (ATP)